MVKIDIYGETCLSRRLKKEKVIGIFTWKIGNVS